MKESEDSSGMGSSEDGEDGGSDGGAGEVHYPGGMLRQAAIFNNVDLLTSLLRGKERRHVNARDSLGRTPLFTCVTNDSYECAQLLISAGGRLKKICL